VPLVFAKQGNDVMRFDPAAFHAGMGTKYFINVGSVGQPRDGDTRSSYVIFNSKTRRVEFRRVAYDVDAAMDRNIRANIPQRFINRLALGR
jgi:diadenosine tetraphosphatase ApaH/serine/threonine PP2A family protein phosphatase